VVRGTAEVTLGNDVRSVRENESIYIPIGSVHRLANPGKIPLKLVEVQVGSYLGGTTSCASTTSTDAGSRRRASTSFALALRALAAAARPFRCCSQASADFPRSGLYR
jgi:hypothetical protein